VNDVSKLYRRILLPLDGSPLAEQALPHAIAQAEHFQAELVLLRVVERLPRTGGSLSSQATFEQTEGQMKAWACEYLEGIAANIQERGIPVQVVTSLGDPHKTIVKFSETNQVDLIVISTRGRSGLSRWLMGSVADRVLRGAKVPVLLVRAQKETT
jgi:nucleotide-binding universal stress UspA family protein